MRSPIVLPSAASTARARQNQKCALPGEVSTTIEACVVGVHAWPLSLSLSMTSAKTQSVSFKPPRLLRLISGMDAHELQDAGVTSVDGMRGAGVNEFDKAPHRGLVDQRSIEVHHSLPPNR